MKACVLFLSALLACQAAPQEKPSKPLDANDPRSLVEHATFNTRSLPSYETAFKAQLKVPSGAPIDYQGECVRLSPGILFVHYTATGGDDKKIVRVAGKDAWVWHSVVEDWVTADEAGMGGAGRGIQNPDEILAVLARYAGDAKLVQPGTARITLTGNDIGTIMKEQTQKGAFDWAKSTAVLDLTADAQARLQKFACDAELTSTDPNVQGKVRYTAEVTLVAADRATSLKFLDDQKREIPLSKDIQSAIDSVKKENK